MKETGRSEPGMLATQLPIVLRELLQPIVNIEAAAEGAPTTPLTPLTLHPCFKGSFLPFERLPGALLRLWWKGEQWNPFSTTGNPSWSSSNTSHALGQVDISSKMLLMLLPAPHVTGPILTNAGTHRDPQFS